MAFLHHWAAIHGVPAVVTSDNGGSFISQIWKGMMDTLNVEVKYSALYRPESIGMLERQHRSLKDSIKAALVEMAEEHQGNWLNHLPFIVLGKNSAFQEDLGASPNELAFGMNFRLPGQVLIDPGEPQTEMELQELLKQVRSNTFKRSKATIKA